MRCALLVACANVLAHTETAARQAAELFRQPARVPGAPAPAAARPDDRRLVVGARSEVTPEELATRYPYLGEVLVQGGFGSSCTGTLIAERWLLTAAHCVPGWRASAENITVVFNATRPSLVLDSWSTLPPGAFAVDVDYVLVHPSYEERMWVSGFMTAEMVDAALLHLTAGPNVTNVTNATNVTNVTHVTHVTPAVLDDPAAPVGVPGAPAMIAGYGTIDRIGRSSWPGRHVVLE